jgi:hypothetical protein
VLSTEHRLKEELLSLGKLKHDKEAKVKNVPRSRKKERKKVEEKKLCPAVRITSQGIVM